MKRNQQRKREIEKIPTAEGYISINKEDKEKFLRELKLEERAISSLRKRQAKKVARRVEVRKPSKFAANASKIFFKKAFKLSEKDVFKNMNTNIKKANISFLLTNYISMMLFATLIAFIASFFVALLLSFFKISLVVGKPYPIFHLYLKNLGIRLLKNIGYALLVPIATFLLFFFYPSAQAASIKTKIENELPFAVIHMSAIAGSGVEPSKVFEIVGLSSEYPFVSKELRKIVNQINLYGYDLVTALRMTGKATSSETLASLLNGLATNIASGGELKSYLEKRAEDMLLDYKLSRKKYSDVAETSMDLYIGVLIAAPLILMVLFILISITGMSLGGLGMNVLSLFMILGIAILNIAFIVFLHLRQPS